MQMSPVRRSSFLSFLGSQSTPVGVHDRLAVVVHDERMRGQCLYLIGPDELEPLSRGKRLGPWGKVPTEHQICMRVLELMKRRHSGDAIFQPRHLGIRRCGPDQLVRVHGVLIRIRNFKKNFVCVASQRCEACDVDVAMKFFHQTSIS